VADPIRISGVDLQKPEVNEYVEMQQYLRRDGGPIDQQPWIIRMIYANWFYLSIASMLGALAAWGCLEPFIDDRDMAQEDGELSATDIALMFVFPAVMAAVGLALGAAEGLICRNPRRAIVCGAVGLGVGFAGGIASLFTAGIIFGVMTALAWELTENPEAAEMPTGVGFLVLIMGRAAAWALAAIPAGMGQGIALRERKVILNGLVGGVLGGLIGGLLFDPIAKILGTESAALSRGVGFAAIGFSVGLFVGLVEGWTKTAWLHMRKGPLAGKQFVLFKDTTVLGSSPKADVYLFKDDAIEPKHAIITNRGGRFEIEDCKTPDGTYVNGLPISSRLLTDGDQIVMGKTVLEFSVKEATGR
jgi:hypothetical protein